MAHDATLVCVLGADTGVGKTTVTRLLLAHARSRGLSAVGLKPFSSGGRQDAIALRDCLHGSVEPSLQQINPWHQEEPLAPLLAARRSGQPSPQLEQVLNWIRDHRLRYQIVLVEGVGGLLTPIAETFSMLDVVEELGSTLVVVVRNRLGAINQARLCYEVSAKSRLEQCFVILSGVKEGDISVKTNLEAIQEFCPRWTALDIPFEGEIHAEGLGFRTIAKKFKKTLAQIF